jgi:hypothetical protein
MTLRRWRRIGVFLLVLAFGIGMVGHAVQAGVKASKMMTMAADASSSTDCQGCGGDGAAKDKACVALCTVVNPAVLPVKLAFAGGHFVSVTNTADETANSRAGPPEPHPPKSDLSI